MLSFFAKKPKLYELIPNGYVDIHSHVLPGIDDGSNSIEETIILLEKMKSLGFCKCIVTPHTMPNVWNNSKEIIKNKFVETKNLLSDDISRILRSYSSEYMLDETFLERLENDELIPIKDSLVLVEMSYLNPTTDLKNILFQLQIQGYTPLLAHPERYFYFHNFQREYFKLKDYGCLFQLNLLSTVGYYGNSVAKVSDFLLSNELIDFVGSDIHHLAHVNAFYNAIKVKSQKKLIDALEKNVNFI